MSWFLNIENEKKLLKKITLKIIKKKLLKFNNCNFYFIKYYICV